MTAVADGGWWSIGGSAGRLRALRLAGAGERLMLAAAVVGLLVLTSLPYAFGYAAAPPDKQFMGILLDVPDTAQYLSWAREFGHAWLIENKLTPEQGEPVFFNLFWLAVGRLARALGLGPAETLQVVRPLAGALYLGAIYWFVGLVAEDRLRRWVGFLAIALGGGLGWLLVVQKQFTGTLAFPLDLYVMEGNTFLTVLAFPHQAMAGGLLVLVLGLSALAFERNSLRLAATAGLLALALGLQHGYDLLIVYVLVGSTALVLVLRGASWTRSLGLCAAVCGWSLPAALYLAYITRQSPIWRGVLAQYGNAGVYTPNPLHLLVLMGLPLILVVVGLPAGLARARRAGRREPGNALSRGALGRMHESRTVGVAAGAHGRVPLPRHPGPLRAREVLLACWLVVGFLLLYVPTDFQIKMLAGWQVPVGVFATRVLFDHLAPGLQKLHIAALGRRQAALGLLFVLAVVPTNVYLYAWRFVDLARGGYPYYLHRDEVAALRWLEANAKPSEVVLSSLTVGQYIPSLAGTNAFLGHWAATLDFYTKRGMVRRFFDPGAPEEARGELLSGFRVRYVLHGEQEKALGAYDPGQSPSLSREFWSPRASVYRVQDAPGHERGY